MDYDREFEVYTDMVQCEHFGVPYFEREAKLVVAASTLLQSKEYDTGHTEFLSALGSHTLIMERTADQGPGWWRVSEVKS